VGIGVRSVTNSQSDLGDKSKGSERRSVCRYAPRGTAIVTVVPATGGLRRDVANGSRGDHALRVLPGWAAIKGPVSS